jgi:hypothetical protein
MTPRLAWFWTGPLRAWDRLTADPGACLATVGVGAVLILLALTGSALHRADQAAAAARRATVKVHLLEHKLGARLDGVQVREACLRGSVRSAQDRLDHQRYVTALLAVSLGRARAPLADDEPAGYDCGP